MKKFRLENIDKKTPFEVPKGYFDKLTADIQERVSIAPKREWILAPKLKWAVSGAFILLVTLSIVLFPKNNSNSAEELLAQIDEQELINYLESIDLSDDELALTLDDQDLDLLIEDSYDDLDLDDIDLDDLLIDYEYELDNLL